MAEYCLNLNWMDQMHNLSKTSRSNFSSSGSDVFVQSALSEGVRLGHQLLH